MAISFNEIPSNLRAPIFAIEFDSSKAQQGPTLKVYKMLAIGQRTSSGSRAALVLDKITTKSQARDFYGPGSMLSQMVNRIIDANQIVELTCISLDDDGAGAEAVGKLAVAGTVTTAGTIFLYVGGRRLTVAAPKDADQDAIALAIKNAINADTDMPIVAVINGGNANEVDVTAKHKGLEHNSLDLLFNRNDGEEFPTGISNIVITAMASGTANPDASAILPIIGDVQYDAIAFPYTDATNLTFIETELESRFGPLRQNDGHAYSAKRETVANLGSFGNGRNSKQVTVMAVEGPSAPWEWAASLTAVSALNLSIDPARPLQTLELPGILSASDSEQFTFTERNLLLFDGIATSKVTSGGTVAIERVITMFQTNAFGAVDTSFLDVNSKATLSFLRFDLRNQFLVKYPRHKLANDGTNFAPGQVVLTPLEAKGEIISIFRVWEEIGLVEGVDQFKRDLIVERNASDPNRLDMLLPPDLLNQFRIGAAQIQFLL